MLFYEYILKIVKIGQVKWIGTRSNPISCLFYIFIKPYNNKV